MIICKEFTFSSAHKLHDYIDKDANLHGHNYVLIVCVKGKIKTTGFVYDTRDINTIIKDKILNVIDHKYLNDFIKQPSLENVCIWIWQHLIDKLPLEEIKLYENPALYVSYRGNDE